MKKMQEATRFLCFLWPCKELVYMAPMQTPVLCYTIMKKLATRGIAVSTITWDLIC